MADKSDNTRELLVLDLLVEVTYHHANTQLPGRANALCCLLCYSKTFFTVVIYIDPIQSGSRITDLAQLQGTCIKNTEHTQDTKSRLAARPVIPQITSVILV